MRSALKAFGGGVLALAGAAALLGTSVMWLWMIGTGEVTGWPVLIMAPVGLLCGLMGLGFVTMIGAALDEWSGQ